MFGKDINKKHFYSINREYDFRFISTNVRKLDGSILWATILEEKTFKEFTFLLSHFLLMTKEYERIKSLNSIKINTFTKPV